MVQKHELMKYFNTEQPVMSREEDGTVRWEVHGQLHRLDGPALETPDGDFLWARYGVHHRDGGPALKFNTYTAWYQDGKLHRDDGPAEEQDGFQKWWKYNKVHRDDGPAIIHANGKLEWWVDDRRHRADGPAVINPDGSEEWWIGGVQLGDASITEIKRLFAEVAAKAQQKKMDALLAPFKGTDHAVAAPEKAAFKKHARKQAGRTL